MNYCKLYIDSELGLDEMEAMFELGAGELLTIHGSAYSLFNNDGYRAAADISSSTYPIDRSKYYVEIDSDAADASGTAEFQHSVAELVSWLRLRCDFVVASCDFEDYIADFTGWNWTLENPVPPAR